MKRILIVATLIAAHRLHAQALERPVAFDSAARIMVVTPPLAARLRLSAPAWPVAGDYVDVRLYATNEAFVLVVRRQRDVLERYPLAAAQRRELAAVISVANVAMRQADNTPTVISEPVRGTFLLNQGLLGVGLFAPAASMLTSDPSSSVASYLAVAGATFFIAGSVTTSSAISRAQNHLAWHSARRGAIAANLLRYSLAGESSERTTALTTLAGGIAGDVMGFYLAEPMTDAEAHGTSHGSTVTAALTAGLLGTTGMFKEQTGSRVAAAAVLGMGALGYPLGLAYVRNAPYRVTAGDVGTLVTTELIGVSTAAAFLSERRLSDAVVFGALTAGFAVGAVAGDLLLVRPYDHTEAESRIVQFGAGAGAVLGLAAPVFAQSHDTRTYFGAMAIGGALGTLAAENFSKPLAARVSALLDKTSNSRVAVKVSPEGALLAGLKQKGQHSLVSFVF
ncbi:MAG: hypothetical protein JWM95_3930 [Gemmatimonadetes bacterium]|nr:hypothetical protein [Gemmatimonadota bacterium]